MSQHSQKILILDDEPDIRELLAIGLSNRQQECHTCAHLHDALDWLNDFRPSLVLSDLKLPDGNGIELVQTCKQRYPGLPVIVITAYGDMESAVEAMRAGAVDYLCKPLNITEIRALIKNHLSGTLEPITAKPSGQSGILEDNGERSHIKTVLEQHRWNKRLAAETLGLSYRQLRYRIEKLGL